MQPQRRLLLLSHYMYTQSIRMMMMRMIVTLMVIMMMRAPISFKKVQPDILDFTFNKDWNKTNFFFLFQHCWISKGWNWIKFWISLSAKVGIGSKFGFHFQQRLELDRCFDFTFSKSWNWAEFWISLFTSKQIGVGPNFGFTFSKGSNWAEVRISLSAKVGIRSKFGFHFQQKLELGQI